MKIRITVMAALAGLVASCSSHKVDGCAAQQENSSGGNPGRLTLYEFMTQKIDRDADLIWCIGNKAISDNASIDPALMTDEDWRTLQDGASRMAADARAMSKVDPIVVKPDGVQIADEGTPGAPTTAQIQGHIAKDHDLFRSLAESLANHADEISAAAGARDYAKAARLINELDGVCESCHLEFWYPEQKALMEQMGISAK